LQLNKEVPSANGAAKSFKFVDGSYHLSAARDAGKEFLAERIPGATWFDIDKVCDALNPLPHMMPSEDIFEQAVYDMGIRSNDHVVVYTHPECFSAARVWYMFKAFGFPKVSILDGGIKAWKAAGGPTDSTWFGSNIAVDFEELFREDLKAASTQDRVDAASAAAGGGGERFKAKLDKRMVVNAKQVMEVVNTGSAQIADARSKARFLAQAPEPRAGLVGGHIPGSLSLPFTALVTADDMTKFRSKEEIRDAFVDAGIIFGPKVIFSCGSGVSAAVLVLGMDLLGKDVSNYPIYDGSWSEWGDEKKDFPRAK